MRLVCIGCSLYLFGLAVWLLLCVGLCNIWLLFDPYYLNLPTCMRDVGLVWHDLPSIPFANFLRRLRFRVIAHLFVCDAICLTRALPTGRPRPRPAPAPSTPTVALWLVPNSPAPWCILPPPPFTTLLPPRRHTSTVPRAACLWTLVRGWFVWVGAPFSSCHFCLYTGSSCSHVVPRLLVGRCCDERTPVCLQRGSYGFF